MRRPVGRAYHRTLHTSGEILAGAGESAPHFEVSLSFREVTFDPRSIDNDTILDSRIWQFVEPYSAFPLGVNSQATVFLRDAFLGNGLVLARERASYCNSISRCRC